MAYFATNFIKLVFKYRFILLFQMFVILLAYDASGQSNSGQVRNSKKDTRIDLEDISDREIKEIWNTAKLSGYSIEGLQALLMDNGYTYDEALMITYRIRELEKDVSSDLFSSLIESQSGELNALERKIYGLKMFRSQPRIQANENVPTPLGYILGPGDEIDIIVYGSTQTNYNKTVSNEGNITFPYIGPVTVTGLSIDATKSLLNTELSRIHSGLRGRNPSASLEITLKNIRTINVNVLGEVLEPGSINIPSTDNLYNILYQVGGPTVNGSLRNIKVYRANKLLQEIDLYNYLLFGVNDQNFSFTDKDVIIVEAYKKRIELAGAVKNPGFYEIEDKETVADLLKFAGGFLQNANTSDVGVERLNGLDQFIKDIPISTTCSMLEDGDRVLIRSYSNARIENVQISGAVVQSGSYTYSQGMTAGQLIDKAYGLSPDAIVERVTVYSLDENLVPTAKGYEFDNLEELNQLEIQKGDVLHIASRIGVSEFPRISVSGEVNKAGDMLFYEGMTLYDALVISRGVKNSALGGKAEIARRIDRRGNEFEIQTYEVPMILQEIKNVPLSQDDRIFIRPISGYRPEFLVMVEGEVNLPGQYMLNNSSTKISDLIQRFDGFTERANLEGVKLLRKVSEIEQTNPMLSKNRSVLQMVDSKEFRRTLSDEEFRKIQQSYYEVRNEELNKNNLSEDEQDTVKSFIVNSATKTRRDEIRTIEYVEVGISLLDVISDSNSVSNIVLKEGDIIFVPAKSSFIDISGEVYKPAVVKFVKNKKFKEYVTHAGGFTLEAKKKRAYIVYANGEAARAKGFLFFNFYPKVKPDAEIIIPGGRQQISLTIDRVLSLTSGIITTFLLIQAIIPNQNDGG